MKKSLFLPIFSFSFGCALFVNSITRFYFYLTHKKQFEDISIQDLTLTFIEGIRFDISSLIYITSLSLIFLLISPLFKISKPKKYSLFFILFWLPYFTFWFLEILDSELIKFFGKRMTPEILSYKDDIILQLPQQIKRHFFSLLICALVIIIISKLVYSFSKNKLVKYFTPKISIYAFIFIPFMVLGIRGGIQRKPLSIAHAYTNDTPYLGHLKLNTAFSLIRGKRNKTLKKIETFSKLEIETILKENYFSSSDIDKPKIDNIIMVIIESLSLEYVVRGNEGNGYAPFIKELSNKSLYFKNSFANGRLSVESLPSIFQSLPSILGNFIVTSTYSSTKTIGFPKALKSLGFNTSFFRGAPAGSSYFDIHLDRIGFDKHYSLENYKDWELKKEAAFDNHWGIYDEFTYDYALHYLKSFKSPFFSTIFTLSTHDPYSVPEKYKKILPKGTMEIHQAVSYADHSLKEFFSEVQKEDFYKNTLFIITADHTQDLEFTDGPFEELENYHIPLMFYHPSFDLKTEFIKKGGDLNRVTQQTDLLPTIIDLLNTKSFEGQFFFGCSVFNFNCDTTILNYWNEQINSFSKNGLNKNPEKLEAFKQVFTNSLIEGDLTKYKLKNPN